MNMNVSLPDELADFVKAKVGTGRYVSPGDVVREALRLMKRIEQQNGEKLAYLRKALAGRNRERLRPRARSERLEG